MTGAGPGARNATAAWLVLIALLVAARLPSLVQPAGADQSLYAYVGVRILEGDLPYRDAWDQKPPAVHFIYALLYAIWPHESVVAAADLLAAVAVAAMLVPLGRTLTGAAAAGWAAAALFLLLGDPTLGRLAGVRVRAQCETFIALAVTAALLLAVRERRGAGPGGGTRQRHSPLPLAALAAGVLAGVAAALKYNAAVYLPVVVAALVLRERGERGRMAPALAAAALGFAAPLVAMVAVFAAGGALRDLYDATITYNMLYSGETYRGPASFVTYLLTFPIRQARVDAIWTVGGLGCLVLVGALARRRDARDGLPVLWVAAACLSIAINGSRGLPQYFVQAAPALALAAGVAAARLWPASRVPAPWRVAARWAAVAVVAYGAWRVTDFDKIPRNAAHDLAYATGRLSRDAHLARYGGRQEDKYVALAVARLARYLEARTTAADTVYVFGFSPGVYVQAGRASASRFFWSRPVLFGFNAGAAGYGAAGLLDDLERSAPAFVVLQRYDWAPPPADSATWFLTQPQLAAWLAARYERLPSIDEENFDVWRRRPGNGTL